MNTVEERVTELIATMSGKKAEDLTLETRLAEDLNMKSVNRINLSVMLEETFHTDFNLFDILKLNTIKDTCDMVKKKTSQ